MNPDLPFRPAKHARHKLLTSILDGTHGPGSALPAERILAGELGVTRPTLRETLHGLQKEGWITIQHGKSTMVNDYWTTGGLTLLSTMTDYAAYLPKEFISHLLSVRVVLLPAIADLAIKRAPQTILDHLSTLEQLKDTPPDYAAYDWGLQALMARNSGNPFYALLLNDFGSIYHSMAQGYFTRKSGRQRSLRFYRDLRSVISKRGTGVERLVQTAMQDSLDLWRRKK